MTTEIEKLREASFLIRKGLDELKRDPFRCYTGDIAAALDILDALESSAALSTQPGLPVPDALKQFVDRVHSTVKTIEQGATHMTNLSGENWELSTGIQQACQSVADMCVSVKKLDAAMLSAAPKPPVAEVSALPVLPEGWTYKSIGHDVVGRKLWRVELRYVKGLNTTYYKCGKGKTFEEAARAAIAKINGGE